MLIYASKLIGTKILSVQAGSPIATVATPIIDPDTLKIIAFKLSGPLIAKSENNLLDVKSIREYSHYGMVIDDIDELITDDDVVKIRDILKLNFTLPGLKVETKKGSKLGKVIDYTVTSEDFLVQQIVVKRPAIKSFLDPELIISRKEIVEITDYKIIVKDEEKVLKTKAETEDFIPNFINPFRKNEQDYAPVQTKNPDDKDN
ncbi:hypothetical protein IKF03_03160 [Candidatus Saccharibacteria bacterium]|nr:hypothetical protein [Candidatus Saccharibacteria bacterium]